MLYSYKSLLTVCKIFSIMFNFESLEKYWKDASSCILSINNYNCFKVCKQLK